MLKTKLSAMVISLWCATAAYAGPPSFNCAARSSAATRLICADAELSDADAEVFGLYNSWSSNVTGADRAARAASHAAWMRERNDRCGLNGMSADAPLETLMAAKPCMMKLYRERKEFYEKVEWQ